MRKSLADKTFLNAIVSYPLTSNGGLLGNMADSSLSSFSSIFFLILDKDWRPLLLIKILSVSFIGCLVFARNLR